MSKLFDLAWDLMVLKAVFDASKHPRNSDGEFALTGGPSQAIPGTVPWAGTPAKVEGQTVFHGTGNDLKSILKHGLLPNWNPGGDTGLPEEHELVRYAKGYTFATTSQDEAATYATHVASHTGKRPLVFRLQIPHSVFYTQFRHDPLSHTAAALKFKGAMPPEWIAAVWGNKRWIPAARILRLLKKAKFKTVYLVYLPDNKHIKGSSK